MYTYIYTHMYIYIYIYIYTHTDTYIFMYIYIQREREKEAPNFQQRLAAILQLVAPRPSVDDPAWGVGGENKQVLQASVDLSMTDGDRPIFEGCD